MKHLYGIDVRPVHFPVRIGSIPWRMRSAFASAPSSRLWWRRKAQAALGGRARYQRSGAPKGYRNGHRHRQLVGTFGALTVSLPASACSTGMAVRRNGGARPSRPTSG